MGTVAHRLMGTQTQRASMQDLGGMSASNEQGRVVVVGGGFEGLEAVKALGSADGDVTLIDRHNYHLFQPLSYQVATGSLSPAEIAVPLGGSSAAIVAFGS